MMPYPLDIIPALITLLRGNISPSVRLSAPRRADYSKPYQGGTVQPTERPQAGVEACIRVWGYPINAGCRQKAMLAKKMPYPHK